MRFLAEQFSFGYRFFQILSDGIHFLMLQFVVRQSLSLTKESPVVSESTATSLVNFIESGRSFFV